MINYIDLEFNKSRQVILKYCHEAHNPFLKCSTQKVNCLWLIHIFVCNADKEQVYNKYLKGLLRSMEILFFVNLLIAKNNFKLKNTFHF